MTRKKKVPDPSIIDKEKVKVKGKTITFKWESSPLTDFVHKIRIERDPILLKAMRRDLTPKYFADLHWRFGLYGAKNHKKNMIQSIFGETGTGKSNIMCYLCDYVTTGVDKEFIVDDICFPRHELIARMRDVIGLKHLEEITEQHIANSRGSSFALDEQKRGNFGEGSYREAMELQTIIDVFRKLQTYNNFISPDLHGVRISHYYLEAWAIDYEKGFNKAILYDRNLFPLGYVLTRKVRDSIWKPYNKKKNKFISQTLHGTEKSRQVDSISKANLIYESQGWGIAKTKNEKLQLINFAFPSLSIAEKESLYALAVMVGRAKKMGMELKDMVLNLT